MHLKSLLEGLLKHTNHVTECFPNALSADFHGMKIHGILHGTCKIRFVPGFSN